MSGSSMPLTVVPLARIESALPPEHEAARLGIRRRTGVPRRVVHHLNAWLDDVRLVGGLSDSCSSKHECFAVPELTG